MDSEIAGPPIIVVRDGRDGPGTGFRAGLTEKPGSALGRVNPSSNPNAAGRQHVRVADAMATR
ncbi:hypothetical protein B4U45_01450 [Mycobacterium persicum]|uniref:Uncharacterized protein n=1 Tax=Mycobacterium persicum TaxID=1487726 RepID=A0A8E2LN80_9MYCO|nr:hypothetical protein [Mycobacterium persicum]KZS78657.1 hypothetical protein A4G31_01410 [Mycobacterium persicum]ORB32703.1 hypothetical protein BST40_27760 [Mycobacterium persicum]ORB93464.1 hypothetical protein B1T44_01505 [Mycobacterium persicum]ORC05535.1 hypothetical protein B4U45_01450 [Mycobacterium persicum]